MTPFAYFGINNSGVNLAINLLILLLVVIWLALVYWTYADARRRIVDPMLIGCATAASLFPFVGTVVYMIVRPPEYLEDVRERELEMQAAEARLHELNYRLCPHCDYEVQRDFLICPNCMRRLKDACVNCSRPLEQSWSICPYCETQVPGAVAPPPRRRRPASESAESAGRRVRGRARLHKLRLRSEMAQRTLILVKPDAFARSLTGEIIARFERKGLGLRALRHMLLTRKLAERHYAEHEGKPFFGELVDFITSGPLVAMVLEGEQAIVAARQVIGATNPLEAAPRLDPRRLRDRGRPEHGPRLGLRGVGGTRDRDLFPGPLTRPTTGRSPAPERRWEAGRVGEAGPVSARRGQPRGGPIDARFWLATAPRPA